MESSPSRITERVGIILVDHGSKLEAANKMLEGVARGFQETSAYAIVEPAHMELAEPTIEQAMARCVERGAQRIVVQLFFLSPGRHSMRDIPRMTREAAAHYPGIPVHISDPLGIDPRLNAILQSRIEEALKFDVVAANDEET